MIKHLKTIFLGAGALGFVLAGPTQAVTLLDDASKGTFIDFKDERFAVCKGETRCTVNGVTIEAFKFPGQAAGDSSVGQPGMLYWDNSDGFGVMGGGQDDEIDPDELIVVEFARGRIVKEVRLSDLYFDTTGRDSANGEKALLRLITVSGSIEAIAVKSSVKLPMIEYNSLRKAPACAVPSSRLLEVEHTDTEVIIDPNIVMAGMGAAGMSMDEAVITRHYTTLEQPRGDINGQQVAELMADDMMVSRVEFRAENKEDNDYSVELILFY